MCATGSTAAYSKRTIPSIVTLANKPPMTLAEAIDELERIQAEPLSLQRALEKLESAETLVTAEED